MTFEEQIAKQIEQTLKQLNFGERYLYDYIDMHIRTQRAGVEYIEELLRRQKLYNKNSQCTCIVKNEN